MKTRIRFDLMAVSGMFNIPKMYLDRAFKDFGEEVTITIDKKQKLKSHEQLGYFYSVVLPWYMYGLIKAGNNLVIGNQCDEKMVESMLKDRHLKNGEQWKTTKQIDVTAPKKFEAAVYVITEACNVKKGQVLAIFGNTERTTKGIEWRSQHEGTWYPEVIEGEVLVAGQRIGTIETESVIEAPSSLANATNNEVIRMIDEIKKEAQEYFGIIIPDPDRDAIKTGRQQVLEYLNQKDKVMCSICKKRFDQETDEKICLACLIG